MIREITITSLSGRGTVHMASREYWGYWLGEVDWGQVSGDHNTYKYYNQVGESIVSTSVGTRSLSITGWVVDGGSGDLQERCDALNKFISPPVYTITATIDPSGAGTVTGAGQYQEGTQATITATPAEGYTFSGWTENGAIVSTDESYTFTVTGNRTFIASLIEIPESRLPFGYVELEYIAVSNGVGFDTGIHPSQNHTRVVMDAKFDPRKITVEYFFGAQTSNGKMYFLRRTSSGLLAGFSEKSTSISADVETARTQIEYSPSLKQVIVGENAYPVNVGENSLDTNVFLLSMSRSSGNPVGNLYSVNPAIDIVLSVVDGAVYLAQNNAGANNFILLECATFTGSESVIEMTALDTAGKRAASEDEKVKTGKYSLNCIPKVAKIGSSAHMAFQISSTTGSSRYIVCFKWTPGAFDATAEIQTIEYCYAYGIQRDDTYFPLFMFSPKNGNEIVVLYYHHRLSSSGSTTNFLEIFSETQGIYGTKEYATQATVSGFSQIKRNIIPVCGNGECLFDIWVEQSHPIIYFANYELNAGMTTRTVDAVSLPSRSKAFKESVVYATAQGLWFVFVGTGLLFAENLADGSWGFLDTQELIGVIGAYGCLYYNSATNSLYISGMDTAGTPKVAKLKLPDLYNYATDGAFLPSLASDGVPAYIKAVDEGGGGTGTTLTVTVQTPDAGFTERAEVLFNGDSMIAGTYTKQIDATGKFTVGVKKTTGTYSPGSTLGVNINGTMVGAMSESSAAGTTTSVSFNASDFKSGVTLKGVRT